MAETELQKSKKIKLVVSDLHMGEGRRLWDGTINVHEDFTLDDRFVELLNFYSSKHEKMELILNGNFFEMLRTRALQDYPDVLFETYAVELIQVIMDGHPKVIEALNKFMENPNNSIVYLIGEADAGVHWKAVQAEIKKRISDRIHFIAGGYLDAGIYVEHAHQYEAMFSMDTKDPFKEVDGLKVLKLPWGAFFYANFVQPLRRIRPNFYRVKPLKNYLMWSFLFETRFTFRVIFQFIRMLLYASSQKLYPGQSLLSIFQIFKRAVDSQVLEDHAEVHLMNENIQKVIFGYSHIPNYRQFQQGKEYFNSGTWTRNLSLDLRNLGAFHRLTYVLVEFPEGQDARAKLMEWQGQYEVIEDYV
jgi:hypothetical protein